jgi:hypothetical protein
MSSYFKWMTSGFSMRNWKLSCSNIEPRFQIFKVIWWLSESNRSGMRSEYNNFSRKRISLDVKWRSMIYPARRGVLSKIILWPQFWGKRTVRALLSSGQRKRRTHLEFQTLSKAIFQGFLTSCSRDLAKFKVQRAIIAQRAIIPQSMILQKSLRVLALRAESPLLALSNNSPAPLSNNKNLHSKVRKHSTSLSSPVLLNKMMKSHPKTCLCIESHTSLRAPLSQIISMMRCRVKSMLW